MFKSNKKKFKEILCTDPIWLTVGNNNGERPVPTKRAEFLYSSQVFQHRKQWQEFLKMVRMSTSPLLTKFAEFHDHLRLFQDRKQWQEFLEMVRISTSHKICGIS
jgi:hypothetical protein